MKKNIYIIIGNGGMGKSTTVRALTGTYRGGWKSIEFNVDGDNRHVEDFHIWSQSAQEGTYVNPAQLLINIAEVQENHILLTLRANDSPDNANDYIAQIAAQHNIIGIVAMGQYENILVPPGTLINVISDPWERPVNGNASRIRKWWGWL